MGCARRPRPRSEATVDAHAHPRIGTIVTGDIANPLVDASAILIEDGRIATIGDPSDEAVDVVIDAAGTTAIPGLIDSHSHPALGDFTPRQRTLDVYDSMLHGGVTGAVSAGEVHVPGGRRTSRASRRSRSSPRSPMPRSGPGGVKVHGGAPILEEGLTEDDIAEMAAGGVRRLGEIGLGSVRTGAAAAPMVAWARAHGMVSTIHTGGPSLPGSSAIGADTVIEARTRHRRSHQRRHDLDVGRRYRAARRDDMAIEIVHNGNGRTALGRAGGGRRRPAPSTGSCSGPIRRAGPASCRSACCGSSRT